MLWADLFAPVMFECDIPSSVVMPECFPQIMCECEWTYHSGGTRTPEDLEPLADVASAVAEAAEAHEAIRHGYGHVHEGTLKEER
jgi:hypothetical protein